MMMVAAVLATLMTPWGENGAYKNAYREYPRPQMERANWTNLNGEWDYEILSNRVDGVSVEAAKGKILVPFCFESPLSGVGRLVAENERMIYRRAIQVGDLAGKRLLLNFEAVDYSTQVFVNGVEATDFPHEGGNLPFSVDITKFVKPGENELVVKVWDPTEHQYGGRGKQACNPRGCFYTRVSGIWQTVWMEEVPEKHIRGYRIIPDIDRQTAIFDFDIVGEGDVEVKVEGLPSEHRGIGASDHVLEVKIPNAEFWSPEHPRLYTFTAKYGTDVVKGYFAMRKSSKHYDRNGDLRFELNNEQFYPLATLDQGWWPDGLLTPPCEEAMAHDILTLKKCGFNTMRKHIKVEPRRYYYLCDKLGIAVIQDLPSGHWEYDHEGKAFARLRYGFARQELKDMVDHLFNVPSIFMWCPYNESWGQPGADLTSETLRWLRRYDRTRLVNAPSGWNDWEGGRHWKDVYKAWTTPYILTKAMQADGKASADTVDFHEYPGPSMPSAGGQCISFLGEYGGLGLAVSNHLWNAEKSWGYAGTGKIVDRAANQKHYLELLAKVKELATHGLAGSVYTQTTDVEIEINGLMTYDRKVLKYDADVLKAAHEDLLKTAYRTAVPPEDRHLRKTPPEL